ncbi:MAG TPA: carbonic anhydrase family protein [Candidatus Binatia bacterium]|jgi:carbonic anhydrase
MTINRCIATVLLCILAPVHGVAGEKGLAAAPGKPQVHTRDSQAAMTPASALEALKVGNARFVSNSSKRRNWSAKVVATATGQYPFAAVLGCMDSRVPVEVVFDQGIGDVFTVRVAGNVVNDDEVGSLEYAVHVGAKLIVVLGHTSCGAVKGAIEGVELGSLTGLLAKIRPAAETARCHDAKNDACVTKVAEQNVLLSMKQIHEKSPYLAKSLDDGTVRLVGAMYDVATGKVTFFPS